MLVLTACSALAGATIGARITRNLTGQLDGEPGEVARIASQIAVGDLNVPIAVKTGANEPPACDEADARQPR
jgi:methyl-accepting chemotaxis protein